MLDRTTTNPAPFVELRHRYYGVIAVDPPSRFSSYTAIQSQNPSSRRDNEKHYAIMPFADLAALPVKELAAPTGCHLFLWTSGPFLPQALTLIEAWGFKYSTHAFTWLKTKRTWDPHDPLTEQGSPRRPCRRQLRGAARRAATRTRFLRLRSSAAVGSRLRSPPAPP
jgi:MT-A70